MPTYQYACRQCGLNTEIKQRISEDKITECPECKSSSFERLISGGTGFLLKGGGWYSDGYGASSDAGTKSESKSTSTSESSSSSASASSGHSCGSACGCD